MSNNIHDRFSKVKELSFLFLTIIICCTTSSKVIAQEPNDSNFNPLIESEKVFEVISDLYEYDRKIPLEAKIAAKKKLPEGSREKIVYTGVNQVRVPAYLVTPQNKEGKYPIVLIADGINGNKERWFEDDSWPRGGLVIKALLENGIAVMILDAVYHGERQYENDYAGPLNPRKFPYTTRQMVIQTAIEYRRAIDYLSTRSDIDTSRIGMMGLSLGSLITFELTAIDSRIITAAAIVVPINAAKNPPIDPFTFASHNLCNSFLMIMGNKDNYYTIEEARELYGLITITQKEFVEYNTGHRPPIEYVEKTSKWFVEKLKQ